MWRSEARSGETGVFRGKTGSGLNYAHQKTKWGRRLLVMNAIEGNV